MNKPKAKVGQVVFYKGKKFKVVDYDGVEPDYGHLFYLLTPISKSLKKFIKHIAVRSDRFKTSSFLEDYNVRVSFNL
jgi:hypothetical protein